MDLIMRILNIVNIAIILIVFAVSPAFSVGNGIEYLPSVLQKEVKTDSAKTDSAITSSAKTDSAKALFKSTGTSLIVPTLMKAGFYLFVVTVLIIGTVFILKWMFMNKGGKTYQSSPVKVVNSTFISPKKSVHIIKIAGRVLVVGATDNQINLLTELQENELLDYEKNNPAVQPVKPFSQHLNNVLGKFKQKEI